MTVPLAPDATLRIYADGTTLVGGDPTRVLRLTCAGARVANELLHGVPPHTAARAGLARRLTDAGLAHPVPAADATDEVTVVIPVRDRPAQLARCLAALGAATAAPTIVVDDGSADPGAVAEVCARAGATVIRHATTGGPAAARNLAVTRVNTELVAFLDSDCIPEPSWLATLCGALSDPSVGAAAPRIRPLATDPPGSAGPVERYAAARSPLDMGPHPARVHPGGRVSYVPSAALLVRRAALEDGFDSALRFGEDVDLVWRIHDAGWTVRYAPAAVVGHAEPARLRELLRRRHRYGTAAGPLAKRHPQRLAPVHLHPGPASAVALACAGRPALAAGAAALHLIRGTRRLAGAGVPAPATGALVVRGLADSMVAIGRATTMLSPGLLAAGLCARRTRPAAAALLLAEPLRSWARARPGLDPVRWAALAVADDVAYGTGVWSGALRARTVRPLLPRRRT